jgi:hypothetical protein
MKFDFESMNNLIKKRGNFTHINPDSPKDPRTTSKNSQQTKTLSLLYSDVILPSERRS